MTRRQSVSLRLRLFAGAAYHDQRQTSPKHPYQMFDRAAKARYTPNL